MNDEGQRLKIAYISARDAQDRRTWSGTYYYVAQALQKYCGDVSYIGPLNASKEKLIGRIINKGTRTLLKKQIAYQHSVLVAKKYAQIAGQRLAGRDFDVIVAPAGAQTTAFLETDVPIVLVDDATYRLLYRSDYHPVYSNLLQRSIDELEALATLSIAKASMLAYSSTWAAQSAIEDYHANRCKVHTLPFGANFEAIPSGEVVRQKRKSDRCRLLFVGVNWERKGGEIALEAFLELEKLGIETELTVCGCIPPLGPFSHKRLTVIPFLDKNDPKQRKELADLYSSSHFLLLPTRNECYGIVLCEANAFGLPVLATNTGGISEIVREGENGFMLPMDARGAEFAKVIADIYLDEQRYAELVASSRAAFDTRLNWDVWGNSMKRLLSDLLGRQID